VTVVGSLTRLDWRYNPIRLVAYCKVRCDKISANVISVSLAVLRNSEVESTILPLHRKLHMNIRLAEGLNLLGN
jgi:hypothetical protein